MRRKQIDETAGRQGCALRGARQSNHLTHADAAYILGITTDELLTYERGSAQVPIEVLEHMFAAGYKMIGMRKLERKYRAQCHFIRKIKQVMKEAT